MTSLATTPDIRVRKLNGSWTVQRRVEMDNFPVWSFVAAYNAWHMAYAVAALEATPMDHDCFATLLREY